MPGIDLLGDEQAQRFGVADDELVGEMQGAFELSNGSRELGDVIPFLLFPFLLVRFLLCFCVCVLLRLSRVLLQGQSLTLGSLGLFLRLSLGFFLGQGLGF